MKAAYLLARGGPETLVVGDLPDPAPGPGDVLVRVAAAAVTPTELLWPPTWTTRTGEPRPLPVIPGHELAGVVAALGPGVTEWSLGDVVYGMNDWHANGAQAELCVAPATTLATAPRTIDAVHAAATPISALTAWQALFVRADLREGQRVLVHGGAGGVGHLAVQLARARGAHVVATASAEHLDFVRSLGADAVIDHRAARFEDVARELDVVLDTVGGETLARSWGVLRAGGRLVTVATDAEGSEDPRVREAFFIVEPNRSQLTEIANAIDDGRLRPCVAATFPLEQAREAYAHAQQSRKRGKVVLRIAH